MWPQAITFGTLLVVTWLLPFDIAAMQWLGGGWSAPYHELFLPALILGSAGLPMRRFIPFGVAVALLALLPALYAPGSAGLTEMLVELAVWAFVIGSLSVLMERIRGQARLARSDPLTRLGNRRAFEEQFEAPGTGVTTLGVGDIDDFKRINDRHGHLAGDACLTSVADALAEHARATDQVFRWGGDEFAVLFPAAPGEAPPPCSSGSSWPSPSASKIPTGPRCGSRSAGRAPTALPNPTCGRSPSGQTLRCATASRQVRADPPQEAL